MKYAHVYVLFLMFVFFTSCGGQNKTDLPKEKIRSETKDKVTSYGSNEKGIDTKYFGLCNDVITHPNGYASYAVSEKSGQALFVGTDPLTSDIASLLSSRLAGPNSPFPILIISSVFISGRVIDLYFFDLCR